MAMIDIEYRYAKGQTPGGDFPGREIRRTSVKDMEEYLRNLVFEMQSADISARYIGTETENENQVYINGMKVNDILKGLEIKMLDPEEDTCGCGGARPITIGRPMLEWDPRVIEDIPDVLMKNSISKVYCDLQKNRIM
ncbi:MAG: hypothetical protein J6O90_01520 [Candidatus Methanomethylophilaceae archaeon]|nr:hypothetical protein [Candidatus Methanomethylophilaceae archaeon]